MASSDAYAKYPQHKLSFDEGPVHVRITNQGEVLAETRRGLNLREGKYPAVVYIPREDVSMDSLERVELSTHCPFKGDATYFRCGNGPAGSPEVAWSYESPFDEMLAIGDHLAFYSDRVTIDIVSN